MIWLGQMSLAVHIHAVEQGVRRMELCTQGSVTTAAQARGRQGMDA